MAPVRRPGLRGFAFFASILSIQHLAAFSRDCAAPQRVGGIVIAAFAGFCGAAIGGVAADLLDADMTAKSLALALIGVSDALMPCSNNGCASAISYNGRHRSSDLCLALWRKGWTEPPADATALAATTQD